MMNDQLNDLKWQVYAQFGGSKPAGPNPNVGTATTTAATPPPLLDILEALHKRALALKDDDKIEVATMLLDLDAMPNENAVATVIRAHPAIGWATQWIADEEVIRGHLGLIMDADDAENFGTVSQAHMAKAKLHKNYHLFRDAKRRHQRS